MRDIKDYEEIINLPHHQSKEHPQMSNHDRAAQFMPFAALKGYDDEIAETARETGERIELGEDTIAALNDTLRRLQEIIKQRPSVRVTYFVPDSRKDGGSYESYEGKLRRIVEVERQLVFEDGKTISIEDIQSIETLGDG